jgi:hypothetical protein
MKRSRYLKESAFLSKRSIFLKESAKHWHSLWKAFVETGNLYTEKIMWSNYYVVLWNRLTILAIIKWSNQEKILFCSKKIFFHWDKFKTEILNKKVVKKF